MSIVGYGGADLGCEHRRTPLGVCEAYLQGKQSFYDGKILRMGHYAKILLARFRLFLGVY